MEEKTRGNDFDISQHTGGKDVTKARHLSCAIKCLIIIIIGILACAWLCISENQALNDILKIPRNKFLFAVIGIMCIAVLAAFGIIVPDKSEGLNSLFNFIELSWIKHFAKNHPDIKDKKKEEKNQAAESMLKAHPLSLPQRTGYFLIYVLAGILAVGIAYFYSAWFYSIKEPPEPEPPGSTTTVPVTAMTDPVTEPTTYTMTVTETEPVTTPPETTTHTEKTTSPPPPPPPTEPPVTTTTDPLIYADNYTYTYISTLSGGEKTTETVIGKAIVGYAGADSDSVVKIQTLDIPDDVAIINDYAFQYCKIHELNLKNVKIIGQSAFGENSDFSVVHLPVNLRYIGAQAFFSTTTVRTFFLNQGWDPFLDSVCFGTPDPFGRPDKIVICETDGTGGYDVGECTENILEWIDAITQGTTEPNS